MAPAVGTERAAELIDTRALTILGRTTVLTDADELALLRSFAEDGGLVGAVARIALRRRAVADASSSREMFSLASISEMLESALGAEKARAVVAESAARHSIVDPCTREHAMRILEDLATMEGLVGVTARFAKARFVLRAATTTR